MTDWPAQALCSRVARPFICYQICEIVILQMNKRILMQIGTVIHGARA